MALESNFYFPFQCLGFRGTRGCGTSSSDGRLLLAVPALVPVLHCARFGNGSLTKSTAHTTEIAIGNSCSKGKAESASSNEPK